LVIYSPCFTQAPKDTAKAKELKQVVIKAWQRRDITYLPEEQDGFLNSGKKSEVISIAGANIIAERDRSGDLSDINPVDLEAGANRCAVS
jgi:hypothetical protein